MRSFSLFSLQMFCLLMTGYQHLSLLIHLATDDGAVSHSIWQGCPSLLMLEHRQEWKDEDGRSGWQPQHKHSHLYVLIASGPSNQIQTAVTNTFWFTLVPNDFTKWQSVNTIKMDDLKLADVSVTNWSNTRSTRVWQVICSANIFVPLIL